MKAFRPRGALSAAICLIAGVLSGCIERYEVEVFNHTAKPVVLRVVQYHSEGFDATPPRQFSSSLIVKQQDVRLGPNENAKLNFDSGAGGFWLRWSLLDGSATEGKWSSLDLYRDKRSIHIR